MLRWLLLGAGLLGLTLGSLAHAAAPRLELTAAAAWKAWSRPGRVTELDIRLVADAATRVSLELVAGRNTVQTTVDLQPGRAVRLQMPVASTGRVEVSATAAGGAPLRREVSVSESESPVLAVATVDSQGVVLDGFHAVALAADDLPRNAAAYASIDALIIDALTLGALDQRQLAALLTHAAACGRIVVVKVDEQVRRLLEGAGGCAGQALVSAATPAQAQGVLAASLASNLPTAMTLAGLGDLARPGPGSWNRVALALAVYFAAAAVALLFVAQPLVLLLVPALASGVVWALLQWVQPASQLLVWSEGGAGAQLAGYQAWQRFSAGGRGRARVAIPSQLAPSVQPCDRAQTLSFEFDAARGQVAFAGFETRLFRQVLLCYAGAFPMDRAPVLGAAVGADGSREIRNAGAKAWPVGTLLVEGQVHGLPALGPGAQAVIEARQTVTQTAAQRAASVRAALPRTPPGAAAALWELELDGVVDAPIESKAWLLVSVPTR